MWNPFNSQYVGTRKVCRVTPGGRTATIGLIYSNYIRHQENRMQKKPKRAHKTHFLLVFQKKTCDRSFCRNDLSYIVYFFTIGLPLLYTYGRLNSVNDGVSRYEGWTGSPEIVCRFTHRTITHRASWQQKTARVSEPFLCLQQRDSHMTVRLQLFDINFKNIIKKPGWPCDWNCALRTL